MHVIDFFHSQDVPSKKPDLQIFADEIKQFINRRGETWLYLAILLIPRKKKDQLLQKMFGARKRAECNSEIKCHDLDKSNKRLLAERWVDIVLRDKHEKSIFFDILGINLSNLHLPTFGSDQFGNIYNRFFRSCVLHGINTCFHNRQLTVVNVFHDKGVQSTHKYFPWHCIYSIEEQSSRIAFNNRQIRFINSDHREPDGDDNSHFIQLIDLLMGLCSHCLDFVSTNRARTHVAQRILPLLERMMTTPMNINSRFGHSRKYLISFFPRKKLSASQLLDPVQKELSGFYQRRPLLLKDHLSNQQSLFE